MSTYRTRKRILGADGKYHLVYQETSADQVVREDGSNAEDHFQALLISEDGVHGMRYNPAEEALEGYNPNTEEWEEISSGSGGGGTPLAAVTNIATVTSSGKVYVKWTDPDDIVIGETVISKWAGTLLVRKAGSVPSGRRDGTVVLDSKTHNAYKDQYFCDTGLSDGTKYYYKFFPYTNTKTYTDDSANEFTETPQAVILGNVSNKSAVASGNGKLTVKWTDPAATIVEDGVTRSTWASTKVVYKEGSYPETPDDGTLAVNSTTRNAYSTNGFQISGLTNGKTYYISIFPISTDGAANTNSANRLTGVPNRMVVESVPSQSGSLTYDGNSKTPSWSNYDSNKMTLGGATSGINAGSYSATFTLKDDYMWADETITAKTISWSIEKASINVPTVSGTLTYNGSEQAVTLSGYDSAKMTLGGTQKATDAGTYTVTVTPTVNYKWSDGTTTAKSVSWSIGRKAVAKVTADTKTWTYDGTSHIPAWSGYNTDAMTISGTSLAQTEAGSYSTTFTLNKNYQWSDGTVAAITIDWSISVRSITVPSANTTSFTYTGSAQVPTFTYDSDYATISGDSTAKTDAGDYSVTFTLKDTKNTKWVDNTTAAKPISWSIAKASISVPTVSGTLTYNGNELSPSWTGYDSAKMTMGGVVKGTNAGSYDAKFTPTKNYKWSDGTTAEKTVSWTIQRAVIANVPSQNGTLTYSGSEQSPAWNNYDTSKMTIGGTTKGTNAGSYNATFTPGANYKWSDGATTAKTVAWAIGKAAGSLSINKTSASLTAANPNTTIEVTRSGDGEISATSSNTGVATVSISGNVITVTGKGTGSATITVKVKEGTNHLAPADKTCSITAKLTTIYGVEWDGTSTTKLTRTDASAGFTDPVPAIGNGSGSSPFDNLMPWSGMVKETDSAAGTLVKIPKFWYKLTQSGNKLKIQISDGANDGFSVSPAHMNRGDGKGERDYVYIGRYHCASGYKSTTGVTPLASITRSAARSGIHNLGTTIWQSDFAMRFTIWLLYIVEFADWESQSKIGYGCGNNSGRQSMGYTDSMTYHTGTTQSNRTTYGLGTQYRWIEGLWDNVYDWMDGCYYNSNGLNIILNPNSFSDSANGTLAGSLTSGYPSALKVVTAGGFPMFVPSASSGSNQTYIPDYWNFNSSYPCLRVGGDYNQYRDLGLFCVYYGSASSTSDNVGCRLQKLP